METTGNAAGHPATDTPEKFGSVRKHAEKVGNQLIDAFVLTALFVLGGTIVWSAVFSYLGMVKQGYGTIGDILLLFIYLELGAMVGIYFKTGRIPAQFLIFVGITVLTRMLTGLTIIEMGDLATAQLIEMRILVIVGSILLLCVAVLVLRFADAKYSIRETTSWLS